MWTNTAFNIYMGQHDALADAAFEPARRREVQLGDLADTQHARATECLERMDTQRNHSTGSASLNGRSMERHPARG